MRPAFFLLILTNEGWSIPLAGPTTAVCCGYQLPHCLKWNATLALTHWSRRLRIQSGCIGRARPPLSPPAMIQCSPPRYADRSTGPRSGSQLRNRYRQGTSSRKRMRRSAKCWFSTVVPSQTWTGHALVQGARRLARCGRFVSSSQSRFGVFSTSVHRRLRSGSNMRSHSNTSAIDAQNTRTRRPDWAASRSHRSGWFQ